MPSRRPSTPDQAIPAFTWLVIQRFLPSEFGNDVDRVHAVEPAKTVFAKKAAIHRATDAAGIPFAYVSTNSFAGYFLPSLGQPGLKSPPRDKVDILGDGNSKAIFVEEDDIGTYTIRAVDDPRTLNKILYLRPPGNIYAFNDLVSLWEKKIGKTLERVNVPDEQLLKKIQEAAVPINVMLAIAHSVFVNGDHTNFEIEPSFLVEASELDRDVKYTTVEEYLNQFIYSLSVQSFEAFAGLEFLCMWIWLHNKDIICCFELRTCNGN